MRHRRIALLSSPTSYRTPAFLAAAERLKLEVIHIVDTPEALAREWRRPEAIDFSQSEAAAARIVELVRERPVDAVVPVDDSATLLAALVASRLGLPHNDPDAALAARDKLRMRERLHAHGVPVPRFRPYPAAIDPRSIAQEIEYPCVVKPTLLSGSRGVIRADHPSEFVAAFERVRRIIASDGGDLERAVILVERFVPGFEVALEGLLTEGQLQVLALFDKPDPLDGPFFEETIYVTPSRLTETTQKAVAECAGRAAAALGLRTGPIHAELRVNDQGPWLIEVAGRSIGGLCSTILEFGTGMTLEELILTHAIGEPITSFERRGEAVGVMMIPIPRSGILRRVEGIEEARTVPGILGIEITAKLNHPLVPLPEGASYLGFIFARARTPAEVEEALRAAHRQLVFRITPEIRLQPVTAMRP
ncbi:ATP-grasp domain-containing protein [Thermomicrobiaceae bacterium CFH 74404]|uniref:ATP-grasp domain-containing protein n=1 Tax=Thermalbibacter longus TaxID=2951981 RepID=A0AA42BBN7_9BACT|nr:ATP-grasp domain-containing protein [Thermalbibacter longus]MCM8750029.1 ATP-grasp domain-containing protein [Thermalbibacter longus]